MQFKHPELLYALFLLLIPIIVHLFQLRRFQKVDFTNVQLLKNVIIQTRKSSELKKWLILCTRLLLLTSIIIAFAQPFLSNSNSFNTTVENVIYLDNSFSMQAKGDKGELLVRAVQDIIEQVDNEEELSIFTNNTTFKSTTVGAIKNDLLQLNYSPEQLSYSSVISKGKSMFSTTGSSRKNLILISDFQQKDEVIQIEEDPEINIIAIQLKPENLSNVQLDSVFISKNNSSNTDLIVSVTHDGNAENLPISFFNDDQLVSKTTIQNDNKAIFSIPSGQKTNGRLSINDNSLQFDNELFFSINDPSKINVLSINEANDSFLKRIYTEDEFNFTSVQLDKLNFNDIDKQNLIVLNEIESISNALTNALIAFTNNGGLLLIIPSNTSVIDTYNQLLNQKNLRLSSIEPKERLITNINFSHPIYDDVFENRITNFQYPKVKTAFSINSNTTPLLSFEDELPFLVNSERIYVFSGALNTNNSNFKNSPLIVPTLYNISRTSLQVPDLYYTIGTNNSFDVNTSIEQDEILQLISNNEVIIPQQRIFNNKVKINTNQSPTTAGAFTVNLKGEILKHVSFNYNRKEGVLNYMKLQDFNSISLSNSVESVFKTIKSSLDVKELWKWFAIFALVFLLIEMLILKYIK